MIEAKDITIAITVFNRRQYLKQAIASALNQTVPVKVIVVEDCGPDLELRNFVKSAFGDRVEYFRNETRRGLFDNWNACIEHCHTPWLSILHDDDYLDPCFVEAMLSLSRLAPNRSLYFGKFRLVDERGGEQLAGPECETKGDWQPVALADILYISPFHFAGQLFRAADARGLGGFRKTSQYCGDWEMWSKLIGEFGSARIERVVAFSRIHAGWERGTNAVMRRGRWYPLTYVQHKRIVRLMLKKGLNARVSRNELQKRFPIPTKYLLQNGVSLSPRLLAYNRKLHLISPAPNCRYAVFQWLSKIGGCKFVKFSSQIWNFAHRGWKGELGDHLGKRP